MKPVFHHFHLVCSDLETTISFFTQVLGAELLERRPYGGAPGARLDVGSVPVFLRVARTGEKVLPSADRHFGYDHLGLGVDDLEAAYGELVAKGAQFVEPPKPGARAAFLVGPDNIRVELFCEN